MQPVAVPDEAAVLGTRLLVNLVLAVPVIAMAMVPVLQVRNWQWLLTILATPVVVYGGWPFHQAAWTNLRHRAATMDTLISVGTLAAFGWSMVALFFGDAGEPGMHEPFTLGVRRMASMSSIYLEVAAGVTVFILAGRFFEARAKRRAGAALRALLELGADHRLPLRAGSGDADRATGRHRPNGVDADEALRLAGALEDASGHPVAVAVAHAARQRLGALAPVTGFATVEGLGVTGTVAGRGVVVGRARLLSERGLSMPDELDGAAQAARQAGQTVVGVGWDGAVRALLTVADTVKPTSAWMSYGCCRREAGWSPWSGTGQRRRRTRAGRSGPGDGDRYRRGDRGE